MMNLNQRRPLSSTPQREERPTLSLCKQIAFERSVHLEKYKLDREAWNERTVWEVDGKVALVVMKGERSDWSVLMDAINAA